jgi:hypothetical protein
MKFFKMTQAEMINHFGEVIMMTIGHQMRHLNQAERALNGNQNLWRRNVP